MYDGGGDGEATAAGGGGGGAFFVFLGGTRGLLEAIEAPFEGARDGVEPKRRGTGGSNPTKGPPCCAM